MDKEELAKKARAYLAERYINQAGVIKRFGISSGMASRIWRGIDPPTAEILAEMGLEKKVIYVEKE